GGVSRIDDVNPPRPILRLVGGDNDLMTIRRPRRVACFQRRVVNSQFATAERAYKNLAAKVTHAGQHQLRAIRIKLWLTTVGSHELLAGAVGIADINRIVGATLIQHGESDAPPGGYDRRRRRRGRRRQRRVGGRARRVGWPARRRRKWG